MYVGSYMSVFVCGVHVLLCVYMYLYQSGIARDKYSLCLRLFVYLLHFLKAISMNMQIYTSPLRCRHRNKRTWVWKSKLVTFQGILTASLGQLCFSKKPY